MHVFTIQIEIKIVKMCYFLRDKIQSKYSEQLYGRQYFKCKR